MAEIISDRSGTEFDNEQRQPDGLPLDAYMDGLRQQGEGDFDRYRQEYLAQQGLEEIHQTPEISGRTESVLGETQPNGQ